MLSMVLPHKLYYNDKHKRNITTLRYSCLSFFSIFHCLVVSVRFFFRPKILSSIFNLNTEKYFFFFGRVFTLFAIQIVLLCMYGLILAFFSTLFVDVVVIPVKYSTRIQYNWMARVANELTAQYMTSIWVRNDRARENEWSARNNFGLNDAFSTIYRCKLYSTLIICVRNYFWLLVGGIQWHWWR